MYKRQADKEITDSEVKLGNKLLVYISYCLAGRAYPVGDIPPDQVTLLAVAFKPVGLCLDVPTR